MTFYFLMAVAIGAVLGTWDALLNRPSRNEINEFRSF